MHERCYWCTELINNGDEWWPWYAYPYVVGAPARGVYHAACWKAMAVAKALDGRPRRTYLDSLEDDL